MSYITFKNICKSYDNKTQVLKGIDLEVEEGELLTLLGPSGCGKSTLLRCLAGLEQVQQGHILLEAAEMLGARRFHSFLTIVVPAILPGLCNSALMCLSGLFGDFAIIKIIASSQFETAQSYLYRNRAQDTQELSAAVVILLLITLLINYLVHKSQDPADRVS